MKKLTIYWHQQHSLHFNWWLTQSSEQEHKDDVIPPLESHEILKADLACMADFANGCKVVVVLDGSDVHFNRVQIPNKAQRHMRKAIPFMLEEQLAEPVDSLFMALGSRDEQGNVPVRAINREYLESIIAAFQSAEIRIDEIVTELDLIPPTEEGYSVVLDHGRALVNDPWVGGWQSQSDEFGWLAQKIINRHQAEEEISIAIQLQVIASLEEQYLNFVNTLPAGRFAPQLLQVSSIEQALSESSSQPINLLQAEYELKPEKSPMTSMMLSFAKVALLLLAVFVVFQGSQIVSLKAEKDRLVAQRAAYWKQVFPNRRVPSSPDRQMQSFMRSLGHASGDTGFLALLDSSTKLISDFGQLYPTNISFNAARGELRLDVLAKDLPTLNRYREQLQQAGHQVDMSSASQRGDAYSSRLIIRRQ